MNCNEARERIEDLGGHAPGVEMEALHEHLNQCADCRRLEQESRDLRARIDALPRSIEPERDLWSDIHARIDTSAPQSASDAADNVVHPRFGGAGAAPRWGLLAAAAMVLIVMSSGLTAWILRSSPATPTPDAGAEAGAITVAWEEFQAAEAEYQKVTDELLETLDARRDRLAPETIQIVEDNLRLIDEAIAEARTALERDPSNAALAIRLTDIYRRRVGFLQQMNRL